MATTAAMEPSSTTLVASTIASTIDAVASATSVPDDHPRKRMHPIVSFIIGLAIILGASMMNAGGLNLTKLDHVRTSALPKELRRRDWLRPLWLLGMLLYIFSQLVGSTLALEFLRAEYVAPLGSSSLVFNFLFANILIGTPVTRKDIYGTVVIVLGVVGIVLFGSINSGLETEVDITRLAGMWARLAWILYFVVMSCTVCVLYNCVGHLDAILQARAELESEPIATGHRGLAPTSRVGVALQKWRALMAWTRARIERWSEAKSDKDLAWLCGIGWALCGGGLAGGCLVFAKACVKLISGTLTHQNTGNQFGHPAAIFTFLFLGITAVAQILCLNRGLKVSDSTLVVPVFYGVYTACGFIDSLLFNDEVGSYQTWDLFLIALSVLILIGGVVLLTNKKPDPKEKKKQAGNNIGMRPLREPESGEGDENDSLRKREPGETEEGVAWQVGDDSDEDEAGGHAAPRRPESELAVGEERRGLIKDSDARGDEEEEDPRRSSSETRVAREDEEFGEWKS